MKTRVVRMTLAEAIDAEHYAVLMGLEFRRTYAPHLRENPAQMAAIARFLLDAPHALFFAYGDDQPAPFGMLGLALVPHPLAGDLYASELFWWVDPAHRTTRAGAQLLYAAEAHARRAGATHLHMVALAANPGVGGFYRRHGYVLRDQTYELALE